jgi:hypothetical protein
VTVVVNGVASEAEPDAGLGVPLVHVMLTLTDAPLFGTKSLFTVKVAMFCVFTIVQEPTVTLALHVPLELYPVGIGVSVAVHSGSPL